MEKIVVVSGKRTAFTAFGGSFKNLSSTDLGVAAGRAALEQAQVVAADIDHIVFGNIIHAGGGSSYAPRHIGLHVGVPKHVPALGVNRLCGSGFEAWIQAAHQILCSDSKIVLAGGTEQMSQSPYVLKQVRFEGLRMGPGEMEDYMTTALTDSYSGTPMAITAENLAEEYQISREQVDEFSIRSQSRYKQALDKKYFEMEITPVEVKDKKDTRVVAKDEHPKPDVTLEKIRNMKPLFKKDGVVTAATASGIVDGAAASVLMSENEAKKRGIKPLARLVSWAQVGCEPKIMGIGPVPAIRKALEKADLRLEQMDLIEVNEAFAAQYLAVEKELKLNPARTNVNGGAIAVGHPLAATGTRIMNHLCYELNRRQGKYAVGSACIGGGQGIAVIIERV